MDVVFVSPCCKWKELEVEFRPAEFLDIRQEFAESKLLRGISESFLDVVINVSLFNLQGDL